MIEPRGDKTITRDNPTPVDRIIAELPGTYYRLTEVAEIVGVAPKTLRRLITKKVTKAPSSIITRGGMQMYLYSPEDVQELKEYYRKEPDA